MSTDTQETERICTLPLIPISRLPSQFMVNLGRWPASTGKPQNAQSDISRLISHSCLALVGYLCVYALRRHDRSGGRSGGRCPSRPPVPNFSASYSHCERGAVTECDHFSDELSDPTSILCDNVRPSPPPKPQCSTPRIRYFFIWNHFIFVIISSAIWAANRAPSRSSHVAWVSVVDTSAKGLPRFKFEYSRHAIRLRVA
ncbi:hypothetical protein BOTBODRAFT_458008 [Botryobasidium botryosum FD-172 SS1]|uniref:Uncharacterized protein n=1 Tax=Botryobasidium botryosum (strain FD-172 SS1) TaxID=930990 RepID=A0A067M9H7_BOTB1|nr:hypothetical protein BOTBODRAFT_458008 [Botryobasidium botryosum FD-172 SS1]